MLASVTPPEASRIARPFPRRTASRSASISKLSIKMMSARAASARSSSSDRLHLDLDAAGVRGRARAFSMARSIPPAAMMWLSSMSTALCKSLLMVVRAASSYRVALEGAEPGRRLARVGDDGVAPLRESLDVASRQGCDPADPLREVRARALGGEEGTR